MTRLSAQRTQASRVKRIEFRGGSTENLLMIGRRQVGKDLG